MRTSARPGGEGAETENVPACTGNSVTAPGSATGAADGNTVMAAPRASRKQENVYASKMEVFGGLEASVQHAGELAGEDNIAMHVPEIANPAHLFAGLIRPVKLGTTDRSYAHHAGNPES